MDPTPAPDAPATGGGGDGSTTRVPCATTATAGLVACFEFEDSVADGTLDDSAPGRHDAATSGLAEAARGASHAAQIGAGSSTRVPQSAALDLASGYTVSMWIQPDALPPVGGVYGLVDHEQQYAMLIANSTQSGLQNRCVHTGVARAEWTERLPTGTWSFLACTWDGTDFCAVRWSSPTDHERFCHRPTVGPAASGTQGLAIGHLSDNGTAHSHFAGALDSLHVYSRGMTPDELCAEVGQGSGCLPCDACSQ